VAAHQRALLIDASGSRQLISKPFAPVRPMASTAATSTSSSILYPPSAGEDPSVTATGYGRSWSPVRDM
jgi:hypothetical protein